jgi:hypothetical protein
MSPVLKTGAVGLLADGKLMVGTEASSAFSAGKLDWMVKGNKARALEVTSELWIRKLWYVAVTCAKIR